MHLPVLATEVLDTLELKGEETVLDGTMNGGGHAREIIRLLKKNGTYIGIEWDAQLAAKTKEELADEWKEKKDKPRIECVHGNYKDVTSILKKIHILRVHAVFLDLGFSSLQMDDPSRGFSFRNDGPLDMRYDTKQELKAYDVIHSYSQEALADIFFTYGEERKSRILAKRIVQERKQASLKTTGELARLIEHTLGGRSGNIHPATRVFQALRIYVNDELGNLRAFLAHLPAILAPGGVCAIISFHSLEDRIVKQAFRDFKKQEIARECSKKPIRASSDEIRNNPRSRSAKLRIMHIL